MQLPTQRDAKLVIRSLGTSGQPPKFGARLTNVGTDQLLRHLETEYLKDHCLPLDGADGGGICKWIEADYGNGKTQFLRCVQDMAWELNYVTAYVELSQDESPLDRPERVFSAVARSLQARPESPADVDRSHGLDNVLSQLFDRKLGSVLSGAPSPDVQRRATEWLKSLQATPVESTALVTAAVKHLEALMKGDSEAAQVSRLYLRGEAVSTPELKKLGVYEKLDKASGFRLMRSMAQLIHRSGLASGVVLLFDEARRTLSLMSAKAQKVACENLLNVIDRCNNGEFPGTVFLYAVMPEFFTNFATNYPALQQRCGPATRINLNHLSGVNELDLLVKIGEKIALIYQSAFPGPSYETDRLRKDLQLIATATIRDTAGTGTRRLLVKTWIAALNEFRSNGLVELSEEQAAALVSGSSEELRRAETAAVEASGE